VGPFEFAALWIVLQMVVGLVWVMRRFDTVGAPAPEFEAWCRAARPVLFALKCAPGSAAEVLGVVRSGLGARGEVVHHRGRHPWTLYLFAISLRADAANDVVIGRAVSCTARRRGHERPELGAIVDGVVAAAPNVRALWVHADLRVED
jgi:hypothetical protein